MALSKLHKSGVMTGYINHFCFACDKDFHNEEDAHAHTEAGVHEKNLETVVYFDKFAGENIRKVKCGYFCELCNIFIKTSTKVAMHVQDKEHLNKKIYSKIKRLNNGVLVNDKVVVEENAWHSMTDDTCTICNTDFDDEHSHKNMSIHIINLVGSKLEYGPNETIYRRVDSTSVQCLTCNIVCSSDLLQQHSESVAHKETLEKCLCEAPKNAENGSEAVKVSFQGTENGENDTETPKISFQDLKTGKNASETTNGVEIKTKMLDFVPRFQKNFINVDFLTETAFCKKCNETLKLDKNIIENHISQHNSKNNGTAYPKNFDNKSHALHVKKDNKINDVKESEKAAAGSNPIKADTSDETEPNKANDKELIDFAKENNLTFNMGESNAYCRVCKVKIPSALKSLTEHVNGKIHQKNVTYMSKSLEMLPKVKLEDFVKSDIGFSGFLHDDIVVNHKYCLPVVSYHCLTRIEVVFGLRCNVCDVVVPLPFTKVHIEEENHKEILNNTSVITCLQGEFVREIRPGMFHCGYCNLLFQNWAEVKNHIATSEHEDNKSDTKHRLRIHMKDLVRFREQKRLEMFLALMHNRFG